MKYFILTLLLVIPPTVFAQQAYSPLINLSSGGNQVQTFEQYINFLYGMSISLAALLAVVKIVIAGTKYMFDDLISGKEDAKKDIQGALLGLLLILSAVIILELINPQFTNRNDISAGFNKDLQSPPPTPPPAQPATNGGGTSSQPPPATGGGGTGEVPAPGSNLGQGLDACVTVSAPRPNSQGTFNQVTANATSCPNDIVSQELRKFGDNCTRAGSTISSRGTGTKIVICSTPIPKTSTVPDTQSPNCNPEIQQKSQTGQTITYTIDLRGCSQRGRATSLGDGSRSEYNYYKDVLFRDHCRPAFVTSTTVVGVFECNKPRN